VNFRLSGGNDRFQYSGNATIVEEGTCRSPRPELSSRSGYSASVWSSAGAELIPA
jgi:hypothetical protein